MDFDSFDENLEKNFALKKNWNENSPLTITFEIQREVYKQIVSFHWNIRNLNRQTFSCKQKSSNSLNLNYEHIVFARFKHRELWLFIKNSKLSPTRHFL